jgi:hypothetical protein
MENKMKEIKIHAQTFWRGLVRTVSGSAVAGMMALSVYGFISLSSESGWNAVFDFVAASSVLFISICCMYLLGSRKKVKK